MGEAKYRCARRPPLGRSAWLVSENPGQPVVCYTCQWEVCGGCHDRNGGYNNFHNKRPSPAPDWPSELSQKDAKTLATAVPAGRMEESCGWPSSHFVSFFGAIESLASGGAKSCQALFHLLQAATLALFYRLLETSPVNDLDDQGNVRAIAVCR